MHFFLGPLFFEDFGATTSSGVWLLIDGPDVSHLTLTASLLGHRTRPKKWKREEDTSEKITLELG